MQKTCIYAETTSRVGCKRFRHTNAHTHSDTFIQKEQTQENKNSQHSGFLFTYKDNFG